MRKNSANFVATIAVAFTLAITLTACGGWQRPADESNDPPTADGAPAQPDSKVPAPDCGVPPSPDQFVPKPDQFVPTPDASPAPDQKVTPDQSVPKPDKFVPAPDSTPPAPYCGDGKCDKGSETIYNCSSDCGCKAYEEQAAAIYDTTYLPLTYRGQVSYWTVQGGKKWFAIRDIVPNSNLWLTCVPKNAVGVYFDITDKPHAPGVKVKWYGAGQPPLKMYWAGSLVTVPGYEQDLGYRAK